MYKVKVEFLSEEFYIEVFDYDMDKWAIDRKGTTFRTLSDAQDIVDYISVAAAADMYREVTIETIENHSVKYDSCKLKVKYHNDDFYIEVFDYEMNRWAIDKEGTWLRSFEDAELLIHKIKEHPTGSLYTDVTIVED